MPKHIERCIEYLQSQAAYYDQRANRHEQNTDTGDWQTMTSALFGAMSDRQCAEAYRDAARVLANPRFFGSV